MYTKNKSKKGFTLIEVLVVVGIIAVISSIFFISIPTARGRAQWVKMVGDFKNIEIAAELFRQNEGFYPCDVPPNQDPGTGAATTEENKYCIRKGLIQTGVLSQWPRGPCPGWEYDWENWTSLVALPTGNAQSQVVRISLRRDPAGGWPNIFHYCIADMYGSTDFDCGGKTGDHAYTLGGVMVNNEVGSLLCF